VDDGSKAKAEAAGVLSASELIRVAVDTASGPHVSPVLFGMAGGRVWFVTARRSLKARTLRERPTAGVAAWAGGRAVSMLGTVRLFDPLAPHRSRLGLADVLAGPFGAASLACRNVLELAGYALDAPAMLGGPSLPGDVLLAAFEPIAAAVIEGGEVGSRWGGWPGSRRAAVAAAVAVSIEPSVLESVPREAVDLIDDADVAVVGWRSPAGPLAVPAPWTAATHRAFAPSGLLRLAGLTRAASVPASLAFDRSSGRRPTAKRGVIVRGTATWSGGATARLEAARATSWFGPSATTTRLGPPRRSAQAS
jgi:hypothetical protein